MVAQNAFSFAGSAFAHASRRFAPPSPSAASAITALASALTLFFEPLGRPLPRFVRFSTVAIVGLYKIQAARRLGLSLLTPRQPTSARLRGAGGSASWPRHSRESGRSPAQPAPSGACPTRCPSPEALHSRSPSLRSLKIASQ